MPPRAVAVPLEVALAKKGGLTLQQLATYDDLITDALVDRVSSSVLWHMDVVGARVANTSLTGQRCTTGPRSKSCDPATTRREA